MTSTLMDGLLPFEHEPYHDFKDPATAQKQREALLREFP